MRTPLLILACVLLGGLTACDDVHPQIAFAVIPALPQTYLRYRVHTASRDWTREYVVSKESFAELREAGSRSYALGLVRDASGGEHAWLRVGERDAVEIDGGLAADERTEAAMIGMRFAEPGSPPELESCRRQAWGDRSPGVCTFVYTPPDGHALWVDAERGTGRPVAFARVAQHDAVEACDDIAWSDEDGALAIAKATCSAIVHEVGRETTTWTLEERRPEPVPPAWARVSAEDVVPLHPLREPVVLPIADPSSRVYVDVEAGGGEPLQLVLDTGSPFTILSRRALRALGVVPSPEPPMHVRPPFLPPDTYDAAIVDRLVVGPLDLHGVRVLVPRNDGPFAGDEAGLLGMDVLSQYVTDVDGPASTLRIWPRERFVDDGSFVSLPFDGASQGAVVIAGEVEDSGPMPFILDTGAPVNIIVGGPAMHGRHPHHNGDEVMLREDGDESDYTAEVKGVRLGPFALPRMPATGHDRRPDLSFLDDDSALVGLGVLRHFRLVIDTRRGQVRLSPGPSFAVLARLGIEIDTRDELPTVTRIVEGEHDWQQPLRVNDVVRAVDGHAVKTRDEALRAIAAARGAVRVTVERKGNRVTRKLVLR
jgi:hypothetical protein